MKRDKKLICKILRQLKESPAGNMPDPLNIEGYTQEEIDRNVRIAYEERLIETPEEPPILLNHIASCLPPRLTWKGYKFLDDNRNDNVWKRVLKVGKEKGGGLAFDVFKALLIQYAKEEFNILPH